MAELELFLSLSVLKIGNLKIHTYITCTHIIIIHILCEIKVSHLFTINVVCCCLLELVGVKRRVPTDPNPYLSSVMRREQFNFLKRKKNLHQFFNIQVWWIGMVFIIIISHIYLLALK